MIEGVGKALQGLYYFCLISTAIAWPLAIWKMVDIILWLYAHVSVTLQ